MRSDRLYLEDIRDAIAEVQRRLPSDRAEFDANPLLQSHVLRYVQVIGEAASRVSNSAKDRNPLVPWRQLSGMRHVLVHDYFRVDWNIVFTTARDNLPALGPLIEAALQSLPPDPANP